MHWYLAKLTVGVARPSSVSVLRFLLLAARRPKH
jgi:hypothetical protein